MANDVPRYKWAQLEDWEPQKERIVDLYKNQNRPLKEVAEIMGREHGFYATSRMYKVRFQKWELTKYRKPGKVPEELEGALHDQVTVPLIRGRVAANRILKRGLSRNLPEEDAGVTNSGTSSRTMSLMPRSRTLSPSPLATVIDAPGKFKHVESCLTAVLVYSQNRLQANKWDPTIESIEDEYSDMWQNKIMAGYSMIKNGKTKDGFRIIDICLKNYKALIMNEHPLLIIETYTTFLYLSLHRLDLAKTILRYVAGLCGVCLGQAHPYTRIWTSLMSLGMDHLRQAAAVVIKTQLAMYETYFKPDAEFMLNQRIDTARQAHCFGSLSIEEAEADIAYAVDLKRKKGWSDTISYLCWANEMRAYIYKHNKRYIEAQAILTEVGQEIDSGSGEVDKWTTFEYYTLCCQIATETGTYEEIKEWYRKRLDWVLSALGGTHFWTMRAVAELDGEYGKRGDVDASAQLHKEFDFESNWDIFCNKEDGESARGEQVPEAVSED